MTFVAKRFHLCIFIALCGMNASCEQLQKMIQDQNTQQGDSADLQKPQKVISDQENRAEIIITADWRRESKLHEAANIQAANPSEEMYLLIFIEPKVDFAPNFSLTEYSQITRKGMHEKLKNSEETGPMNLTVDNKPALQYVLKGTFDFTNIVYVHTVLESSTQFYQILLWTTPSRFIKHRPVFDSMIQQFREIAVQ